MRNEGGAHNVRERLEYLADHGIVVVHAARALRDLAVAAALLVQATAAADARVARAALAHPVVEADEAEAPVVAEQVEEHLAQLLDELVPLVRH